MCKDYYLREERRHTQLQRLSLRKWFIFPTSQTPVKKVRTSPSYRGSYKYMYILRTLAWDSLSLCIWLIVWCFTPDRLIYIFLICNGGWTSVRVDRLCCLNEYVWRFMKRITSFPLDLKSTKSQIRCHVSHNDCIETLDEMQLISLK